MMINQNWLSMILSSSWKFECLILKKICHHEIWNDEIIKQTFFFWTCENLLQMNFWNIQILWTLFFYLAFVSNWPTTWLTTFWSFWYSSWLWFTGVKLMIILCHINGIMSEICFKYISLLLTRGHSHSRLHLTSSLLVTCSKWQFRGSPGH